MGIVVAIIFGIAGLAIGYVLPRISNQIIERKLAQRQRQREMNFLDKKATPIWFALGNGLAWGVIGYFASSVPAGLLMGVLITMAVMFTVIDGLIHIIPNELILIGLPIAVLFQLTSFDLKHLWIAFACMFRHKVGASLTAVRRAGGTATLDQLNKYLFYAEMPVATSNYWDVLYGRIPGDAQQDGEGLQAMRILGKNMAWMLQLIENGKGKVTPPEKESKISTSFVR